MTKELEAFIKRNAIELAKCSLAYERLLKRVTIELADKMGCALPKQASLVMIDEICDNPPDDTAKAWEQSLTAIVCDMKAQWRRNEAGEKADELQREVERLRKIADD